MRTDHTTTENISNDTLRYYPSGSAAPGDSRSKKPPSRMRQRASLRVSIDAKCLECIYDPRSGNGGWREQVEACTSRTCPLYPVRPLPKRHGGGQ